MKTIIVAMTVLLCIAAHLDAAADERTEQGAICWLNALKKTENACPLWRRLQSDDPELHTSSMSDFERYVTKNPLTLRELLQMDDTLDRLIKFAAKSRAKVDEEWIAAFEELKEAIDPLPEVCARRSSYAAQKVSLQSNPTLLHLELFNQVFPNP